MPQNVPRVAVVGGTYVDMAIRCEHIPQPGSTIIGSALSYTITGPGPNEAAQAALCGCEVHLISKVGGDPFGQLARNRLEEFNVNTDFVYTAEVMNTGTFVTLVNSEGENASCIYTGANSALSPRDIETAEQIIADANVCLIHGRLPQKAIISAIRCAELHGTKIILNPASPVEKTDSDSGSSDLPHEYFSANIFIPNLYEAGQITDHSETNIREAKLIGSDLVARGIQTAVITMGKKGCVIVDRNGSDYIPAFDIKLVDQTCTGDAFAGALAAYCAVKNDIREAVKFACAAGALVCTKFGAIEALPSRAEIIELLQKEDTE
jgi:ribokinase